MRITDHNKKFKLLKLYYDGLPATVICKKYRVASSTLYKWINDYPREVIYKTKHSPINVSKLFSHSRKVETEIEFLRRTVVKGIPLKRASGKQNVLRSFLIRQKYKIPKEYLIEFMMSARFRRISTKSKKHKEYIEQMQDL